MIRCPFQKMVAFAFKPWPCPCISWKTHWWVPKVRFYEAAAGGPKMPLASVTGVANVPAMMGKYFVESSGYWGNVWKCVDMIVAEDGDYSHHKGWCPGSCLRKKMKKNNFGRKALFLCSWLPKSYHELQWKLSSLDSCYWVTPQRNAFRILLENAKPHEVTIAESMAEVRGKDDPEHVLPTLRKLEWIWWISLGLLGYTVYGTYCLLSLKPSPKQTRKTGDVPMLNNELVNQQNSQTYF